MSSTSPHRVTRPRGQTQREDNYAILSKPLQFVSFPLLRIYLELDEGPRIRVDQLPEYAPILTLVQTVLSHMAGSNAAHIQMLAILDAIRPAGEEELKSRLGELRDVTSQDIVHFFTECTPAIILTHLRGATKDELLWGEVRKLDSEGAEANEVFILLELAATLRDSPPSDITQIHVQKIYHRLLLSTTLAHELIHALTKHFYSPSILTPFIGCIVADEYGNGEAGQTYERNYLGFQLQAAWTNEEFKLPERMWHISLLLAYLPSELKILDPEDINKILAALERNFIWKPYLGDLKSYTFNANTHIRHQLGFPHPMADEVHSPAIDLSGMVMSTTCLPRVGHGLNLP
ncbi:hypothetical protein B0H19DRAFT_1153988 [Mycena capillaripes]|nr:hypothetical protein B0H19DRAFT_1153988 [Mycena capillaripes]